MATLLDWVGCAVVSKKGAARLDGGHPWIYQSDVRDRPGSEPGVVELVAVDGRHLGQALYSPTSLISLRLLTRQKAPIGVELLRDRLRAALSRRERYYDGRAYRWVHGEADLLPSIFIDRYDDAVTLQTLSAGADKLEPLLIELIVELAAPRAVVVRDDATSRQREGLPTRITVAHGAAPVTARYREGELTLEIDLLAEQKTGDALDQAQNHVVAARYAAGDALDCFTYHGGFALQLARVAKSVTAVDLSEAALARARDNAARAGLGNIEFLAADVFELLPALLKEGRRFDTVVLDPPAFASNKASEERARGAYKEINLRAMRLLAPGGTLVTCSCSGRITPVAFDELIESAAREARRGVQLLERRGAGPDHPVLAGVPETEYLKCRVLCVL